MDRESLLATVSGLRDPAEISQVLAEALLRLGDTGDDALKAVLLRRLADEQIQLGHETRGLQLLDIAVDWDPEWFTLYSRRVTLQDRGEDLLAVAKTRALLTVASKAANTELFHLYDDLGLPALALDARRQGLSLPENDSRRRLRDWWISGGPLWFVRNMKRRRETARLESQLSTAAVESQLSTAAAPQRPAVDDLLRAVLADFERDAAAARLAGQVEDLILADDAPAAARLLVTSMSSAEPHPRTVWDAAYLASRLDDPGLGLQFCAHLEPHFGGLTRRRAEMLLDLDRLREAWTLVGDDGRSKDFRDVRAKILLAAGLPYLAASHRRDTWGRLWWLTGGPLWFVRARGRRRDEANFDERIGQVQRPIEELTLPALATALGRTADVATAVIKARGQRGAEAVATLDAVHHTGRPTVSLLLHLAWALYLDNHEEAALQRIREARALEPGKASLLDAELTILSFLERYFEALEVSDRYAEEFGRPPSARSSRGYLLGELGLVALSFDAFGWTEGTWERSFRRRRWWLSGGPLPRVRARMRISDQSVLNDWTDRAGSLARVLASVMGPGQDLRVVPDRYLQWEIIRQLWWARVGFATRWVVVVAGSVLGGAAVGGLARDMTVLWFTSIGVAGALVVFGLLTVVQPFKAQEPGVRFIKRSLPFILLIALAGYGATTLGGRWPSLIGASVLAAAAVTLLRIVALSAVRIAEQISLRRLRRTDPRGFALVCLLVVLAELKRPVVRRGLWWRRQQSRTLEQVALRFEVELPAAVASDPASLELLRHGGRNAAAAIRKLKYLVVAAPPGAERRLETVLRTDITALATGSLAGLEAIEPPKPITVRRSRRQMVVDAVRTLIFAGLPLGVVLAAQPWLGFNETILNWARLITIGWALLYVLLTADHTFRDKLRTAFALINRDPTQLETPEKATEKRLSK